MEEILDNYQIYSQKQSLLLGKIKPTNLAILQLGEICMDMADWYHNDLIEVMMTHELYFPIISYQVSFNPQIKLKWH